MKRVLFVAYPFPPEGGAAIKRTLKFIKYLPSLGWEPIVLTVKNGNYEAHDPSLLNALDKNLRVFRAFTPELFIRGDGHPGKRTLAAKNQNGNTNRIRRIFKRNWGNLYHLIGKCVGIPDAHILWLPTAFLKGIYIILKYRCQVIYATGPTFTDHVLGVLLKKVTGRRLVLDFRDAWLANPVYRLDNKLRKKIDSFLEKKVIMESDVVVSTTAGISDDFRRRYPQANPEKFITITNGFDPEDLSFAPPKLTEKAKFRIIHTGILILERSPKYFLQAFRKLIDEQPDLENEIEIIFVGKNFKFGDDKQIEDYIVEMELQKVVEIKGFVSRAESLVYQQSADLLLLIIGIVPKEFIKTYGLSGKAFDYAFSGKPILALAQDGATAEFVRRTNIGCVIQPGDVDTIKNSIREIYHAFKCGKLEFRRNNEEMEKYNLKVLTRELARCFDYFTTSRSKGD